MAVESLRGEDKRLVAAVALVLAASAAFTIANYSAAFPQASIELRYTKAEITEKARRFLKDRGFSTEGFHNITLFDSDTSAQLFLERELGLEEANRLMERDVSVWRWRARWFRPPEKEELRVYLAPDGRLVGFRHVISEAEPGARLRRDEAYAIAERFLQEQTSAAHRLVEERLEERPARYDYVFTWEQEGFQVKDATYRRTVVIQGADVGEYSEYLHVPERWTREYARLRSANELYATIAWSLFALLIVAAVAVLVRALRRHEVRWKPLLVICGVVGAVAALNEWNLLPFYVDGMPTSSTFHQMVLLSMLSGLGTGVGYLAYVLLGAAPGLTLYRRSAPERLALPHIFSARGLETREFFRGAVAGLGFAGFHLAYVVAFYLLGKRFGVWTPQDVGYSDVLSTAAPWLYPMAVGILASTSEEFWFRLLAIPLLKKHLKSSWLAVLIPAFLWGFLHANYPQQPGYIRGVEVGIIGVAAGWLFLRFGIVATLVWHYTIDALLVSTMLFEAQGWHYRLSGILVSGAALAPLGYCLWRYRRRGGFVADEALLNRAAAPEAPRAGTVRRIPGEPIRAAWPVRYLYLAAAGALAAGLWLKPVVFGDFLEIKVPRAEALRIADAALRGRGEEPERWRRAATFLPNLSLEDFEYLRQVAGAEVANRVVGERTFHGVWYVRYVRPLERQEWRIYVRQDGKAYRVDHLLAETDPGADLPEEEALALARDYVTREQQIDLAGYRLVSSKSEKRERRRDYEFVWEDTEFRAGEARARLSLSLLGDEPAFFRKFLKLPEEWLRAFRRPRLQQYVAPALLGALATPLLVLFVLRLGARREESRTHYRWRFYAGAGAVAMALSVTSGFNQWQDALLGYDTAQPFENFAGRWLLNRFVLILITGLGAAIIVTACDVFLQLAAGYRRFVRPSLRRTASVTALMWGLFRMFRWLESFLPGERLSLPLRDIPGAGAFLPALSAVTRSAFATLLAAGVVIVAGAAAYRYLRSRWGAGLLFAVLSLVALSRATNVWQWGAYFAEAALAVVLLVFIVHTLGLDPAGFAVSIFWLEAAQASTALMAQPAADMRWNGATAAAVCLAAGWAFLHWFARYTASPRA